MVVFSNRWLGPAAELLCSREVADAMLREVAAVAAPLAAARWEHELATWLERCAASEHDLRLDVTDLAWTPDNFERQRAFLLDAIRRAAEASAHHRALGRWAEMIEAHPRESVQVGRRWRSPDNLATI